MADIKKMCNNREKCARCPFYDKELHCRLRLPFNWLIDDWTEYKEV